MNGVEHDPTFFFWWHIDPFSLGGQTMALLLSALLGGLVGLERELHGHPAGMRTHILVCLGSTLITLTSVAFGAGLSGAGRGDPARLAAQIVTGIGFLGAGAILRDGGAIRGLTTAASIWAIAGIGIALGTSPRMGELGVIATLIVLVTLNGLNRLEDALSLKQRVRLLEVEIHREYDPSRILTLLVEQGVLVFGMQVEPGASEGIQLLNLRVRLPGRFDRDQFEASLTKESGVRGFRWK